MNRDHWQYSRFILALIFLSLFIGTTWQNINISPTWQTAFHILYGHTIIAYVSFFSILAVLAIILAKKKSEFLNIIAFISWVVNSIISLSYPHNTNHMDKYLNNLNALSLLLLLIIYVFLYFGWPIFLIVDIAKGKNK